MMRRIIHPGKSEFPRILAVPTRTRFVQADTPCGMTLLDAIASIVSHHVAKSGVFRLSGGAFSSFSYVMPALSNSPDHAVYFSETFYVQGMVELETAEVTFGQRDGEPWLHCHAVWIEPSGRRYCGHLLPDQVMVAQSIKLTGLVLDDAVYTVSPDSETNFSLFIPQAVSDNLTHAGIDAYALRLAPNEDICTVLENFCAARGIRSAKIYGGVGSTVGAVFQDGRIVEPFVTELLMRRAYVRSGSDGHPSAEVDITMVDYMGGISEGRLAKGANPVLVTAELVLAIDQ
jgi:predicted DNA-binding protein with PD1-like motif